MCLLHKDSNYKSMRKREGALFCHVCRHAAPPHFAARPTATAATVHARRAPAASGSAKKDGARAAALKKQGRGRARMPRRDADRHAFERRSRRV
ncbi:hypothetical protein HMPREF1640_00515 [Prevotella sp. S7-1-8]|nr:hypothetical protein HMPREF1640_00515 [Prevotella sp. S7-1-8]